MLLSNKTILKSAASRLTGMVMTPAERARGRFLRAPDGHDAAAPAADPAPAPDAAGDPPAADPAPADDDGSPLGGKADAEPDADADKGDDTPAPRPGAPEKYDLKLSEELAEKGVKFDDEAFGEVEPLLREMDLSNEEAQKLVDAYAGKIMPMAQQRADAAINDRAKAQRQEWSDAFDADPEIGGAKRDATLQAAARAFDYLGMKKGEGFRQFLDESGLGFHPEMIRAWSTVGNMLAEGSFERGDTPSIPKTPEAKLYGAEFQPK